MINVMLVTIYKKASKIGYKTALRRMDMELEGFMYSKLIGKIF